MNQSEFGAIQGTLASLTTSATVMMEIAGARVKVAGRNGSRHKRSVEYSLARAMYSPTAILAFNGRRALVLSAMPIEVGALPQNTPVLRWRGYGQGDPVRTMWAGETIPATLVREITDAAREFFGVATVESISPWPIVYVAYLRPATSARVESLTETPLEDWFQPLDTICGGSL